MRICNYARRLIGCVIAPFCVLGAVPAFAAQTATNNSSATIIFLAFVVVTLGVTYWAAKQTTSREAFFAAKGQIPAWQNGLAIAGDFMSAATFLGITGLMYFVGYDGFLLALGIIVGWPLMLMIIAERFRNLGKYTFVDVVTYRLEQPSLRILAALASLVVVLFYLIGQIVGAGKLIELLFGVDYFIAIIAVNILMMLYVLLGGMIATTWVQIIKAVLLLFGGLLLAALVLNRYDFDVSIMLSASTAKHSAGEAFLSPGGWLGMDFMQAMTVGLTMCFGIMGLPHILMRFFTVKDAAAARSSVSIATLAMSAFYIVILVIGFGSAAILIGEEGYFNAEGALLGGSNLVALHVADILGGEILLGYMSAVTFATILAVVAGLTLAGAAAVSHDLYALFSKPDPSMPKEEKAKRELMVSRVAAASIAVVSLLLGAAFENQNIAVTTSMALAVAASINFPLLLLAMYWRGLTSKGAMLGGAITLTATIILIILSEAVWVRLFGFKDAIFPYLYPTVVTMPIGFILMIAFSLADRSATAAREQARFDEQFYRAETGAGVS